MNILIIASKEDIASMNIRQKLLALAQWEEYGKFDENLVYSLSTSSANAIRLATINDIHIFRDFPDTAWPECDTVIFVSRHKSASNLRSLTVHPIGNYGKAEFGGKEGKLVPSAPALMTEALQNLSVNAEGLDFSISFEVTHHGPYLEKPTFFIEIGSDENAWKDDAAAKAVAKALMDAISAAPAHGTSICIGIGGGHYAPRFSDLALKKKISFGHMIPDYQIKYATDEDLRHKIAIAVAATPGCAFAYLDKKSLGKEIHRIERILDELGIKRIRGEKLEDSNPF